MLSIYVFSGNVDLINRKVLAEQRQHHEQNSEKAEDNRTGNDIRFPVEFKRHVFCSPDVVSDAPLTGSGTAML